MNASRASDPRVDARIVSFGSRAFCLDRVLDPKRPARALASRFPRLRVSRILLKKKPLGRDDADHGTPSHSSTRRVPRPRVARLALVTRAPPRLAPPPSCECMSRIDRYPASDRRIDAIVFALGRQTRVARARIAALGPEAGIGQGAHVHGVVPPRVQGPEHRIARRRYHGSN